jgi:hypothetical protein
MLSTLSPPLTLDFDVIRQKRLRRFLVNCAKVGEKTPLPLDATLQDNATFDTMLEVAYECEDISIPTPDRSFVTTSTLPLPPTPETGAANCIWDVFTNDQSSWTPDIPEHDGGSSPNFPEVLASFLYYEESRNDGYYDDYDPEEDEYCVACPAYGRE